MRPVADRERTRPASAPWADDDHLVGRAFAEDCVMLTRDQGLLSRTALPQSAVVRGDPTED